MRQFIILGTFNAKSTDDFGRHRSGMFSGKITVNENGKFEGKLVDAVGISEISGFTDEKEISFDKYYFDKEGQKEERVIKYFLLRRDYMSGWSGTWKDLDPKYPEGSQSGQALVSLFEC